MSETQKVTAKTHGRDVLRWSAGRHAGAADRTGETGPSEVQHLLVALASSLSSSAMRVAERKGIPLEDVRFELEMDLDARGAAEALRVRIEVLSPADGAAVSALVEQAERASLVWDLLGIEPDLTLVHHQSR